MNHPKLTVYNASAGAGKTYKLVEEILQLLLKEKLNPDEIVVITFARNAAAELLHRTLNDLKNITTAETPEEITHETYNKLLNIFGENFDFFVLKKLAEEKTIKLLLEFNSPPILTIDKFILKLFYNYTFLLGLDLNAEQKNELNYEQLLVKILSEKLPQSEDLVKQTEVFLKSQSDSSISFSLGKLISNIKTAFFNVIQELPEIKQDLKPAEFLKIIEEKALKWEQKAKQKIEEFLTKFPKEELKKISKPENFHHKTQNRTYKFIADIIKNKELLGHFMKDYTEAKRYECKVNPGVSIYEIHKELYEDENRLFYINYYFIKDQIVVFNQMIWKHINALNEEIKNSEEIDLKMIAYLFNYLVRNDADVPFEALLFVETKLGKLKAILIDEFQDTSYLQYNILKKLMAEVDKNIIVGDAKQSIYRWRGAEPTIMSSEVIKDFREHKEIIMNSNYRSAKNIVEFNNRFYKIAKKFIEEILKEYSLAEDKYKNNISKFLYPQNFVQQPTKDTEGWVKINLLEGKEVLYREMIEDIKELIEKYNFNYSDIMILVRKNEIGKEILKELHNNKIPAYTESSTLTYKNNVNVRLFINSLKYLLTEDDEKKKITLDLIFDWQIVKNGYNYDLKIEFETTDINSEFPDGLKMVIENLKPKVFNRFPLPDIVEEFIRSLATTNFVYDEIFSLFYDEVCKFSYEKGNSIIEFLRFWENELKDKNYEPSQFPNSVRILTIHKAKGLESPVVLIPYFENLLDLKPNYRGSSLMLLNKKNNITKEQQPMFVFGSSKKIKELSEISPGIKTDFHSKSLSSTTENINTLYVATTRPKEGLILYFDKTKFNPANKTSKRKSNNKENLNNIVKGLFLQNFFEPNKSEDGSYAMIGNITPKTPSNQENSFEELSDLKNYSEDWRQVVTFLLPNEKDYENIKEGIIELQTIGTNIHKLLAFYANNKKFPEVNLSKEEKTLINNFSELLHNNKILQEIFSGIYDIFPEQTIKHDDLFIIDLLAIGKDKIFIVEYKTGNKSDEHKEQVKNYEKIISEYYNNYEIKSLLVYLKHKEVIEV